MGRHPGLHDPQYRLRRSAIIALAHGRGVGESSLPVAYSAVEHATWRTVHAALEPALRAHACRAVLEAHEDSNIRADRIPQHAEVGAHLRARTGFDFTVAGGFVRNRRFLGSLEHGYFHAVQFVRHPAAPLYTPEPDVIHDVFGHGVHLTSPRFADLYRLFGRSAGRLRTRQALDLLSRVYWYTLEFGVVAEAGTVKAYGAALLSSPAEISRLPRFEIRAWDLRAIATTPYRAEGYQPFLFAARSMDHLADALAVFCEDFDDDTGARLGLPPAPQVPHIPRRDECRLPRRSRTEPNPAREMRHRPSTRAVTRPLPDERPT
ncbi:phenylalanine 4-monooxygenase [Embleya sp. NBC_00896]|uniref:phenylalanine 4-monooxygenase n=1 Tax=Embleya sp. NBC_00896 TaxID=2975961 RepID=UPI002F9134E3|nr:phenylalanine 4-monooxygenase [Embleya sp. NBC_00896]